MTVDQLMQEIEINTAYAGDIKNDDMILAVNPYPGNPDVPPNDYIVCQDLVRLQDSSINTTTSEKTLLRVGTVTNVASVSRAFEINGYRVAGDPFQDLFLLADALFAKHYRHTDYVWFCMINGKGERGIISSAPNQDTGGTAGERSYFELVLNKGAGLPEEYVYNATKRVIYGLAVAKDGSYQTRLEKAAGCVLQPQTPTIAGHSDFDDMPIFKDIKRCVCDSYDGTVLYYDDDARFDTTTNTQMVQFPRFWIRREDSDTEARFYISNYEQDGFQLFGQFAPTAYNEFGHENIWLSPYFCSIIPNTSPAIYGCSTANSARSGTIATDEANIKSRQLNYHIFDVWSVWMYQWLAMIESGLLAGNPLGTLGSTVAYSTKNIEYHTGCNAEVEESAGGKSGKYRHIEYPYSRMAVTPVGFWTKWNSSTSMDAYITKKVSLYSSASISITADGVIKPAQPYLFGANGMVNSMMYDPDYPEILWHGSVDSENTSAPIPPYNGYTQWTNGSGNYIISPGYTGVTGISTSGTFNNYIMRNSNTSRFRLMIMK